jgi:hypothetical protein
MVKLLYTMGAVPWKFDRVTNEEDRNAIKYKVLIALFCE